MENVLIANVRSNLGLSTTRSCHNEINEWHIVIMMMMMMIMIMKTKKIMMMKSVTDVSFCTNHNPHVSYLSMVMKDLFTPHWVVSGSYTLKLSCAMI